MFDAIQPNVFYALTGVYGILIFASLVTIFLKQKNKAKNYSELQQRVSSWWVMVLVFTVAILVGEIGSIVFMAFVSFLALKEYFSLIPTRRADRRVLFWVFLAIPIQYYWVAIGWYGMFIIFIPVFMFLLLPTRMVLIGETKDFLRANSIIQWGMMTMLFCISHASFLLVLPAENNPNGGGAALLLYLIFLTQFNDVMQYVWGKMLGKHKVIPKVSPGKTVEGLVGGVATTVVLATILAPWLTPLETMHAAIAGLIIGLGGFIGDVTMSSLKRDIGVKDSGGLLPGHGGVLDRIDSLIFTAPLFFHFIFYVHY